MRPGWALAIDVEERIESVNASSLHFAHDVPGLPNYYSRRGRRAQPAKAPRASHKGKPAPRSMRAPMASLPALAVPTMSTISPTVPNAKITAKGVSSRPHPSPLTARRAPTSNVAAPSSMKIGNRMSPASARGYVIESERPACCAGLFEVSSTFTTTAPKISRRTAYRTAIAAATRMPLGTWRLGLEIPLTFTQIMVRQSRLPASIERLTTHWDGLRPSASRRYRTGHDHPHASLRHAALGKSESRRAFLPRRASVESRRSTGG
jgi:hypothetical protein